MPKDDYIEFRTENGGVAIPKQDVEDMVYCAIATAVDMLNNNESRRIRDKGKRVMNATDELRMLLV